VPEVRPARPGELDAAVPDLVAVLVERYAGAPWHESPLENAAGARHLVAEAGWPGTVTAVAFDGTRVVGIAQGGFGETFLADLRGADPVVAAGWGAPVFELRQLVVAAAAAGRGVGGRLHDTVMGAVTAHALLLTHPDAGAALALYGRRGWRTLATAVLAPGHPRLVLGRTTKGGPP
jgi:GNAT superfamily N-acetyltransferase